MLLKTKSPDGGFAVPPLTDISPRLLELMATAAPLGAERTALKAEDFELARSEDPGEADAARTARVAAVLGRAAPATRPNRSERRQQIADRLRDLDQAIEVLDREMQTERARASAVARERALPEYKRLISALCQSLISIHTTQIAIRGMANRLQAEGYSSGDIGHHLPAWLGSTTGPHGNIAGALREFVSAGLYGARDIPAEMRPQ